VSAVALYRDYELPWTPSEEEQRRLRRVLGAVLGLFIAFGVIIPLLPERERSAAPPVVPERVVEFLLERPKPKPQPPPPRVETPKPVELPKPQAQVVKPPPEPKPVPKPQAKPDPKQKAASTGLLALSQQLAELRQLDVATKPDAKAVNAGAGEKTRVDRALLTARAGQGSTGIAVSAVSSGFGGGAAALKGHDPARVAAPPSAAPPAEEVERSGRSLKASRTREEIELVFDRNKSAIYALYSRALRDKPTLQGKVVLEVTIAPSGEVTDCRVVSSELNDAELERKLVARVRMFRFEARDVAVMTTTKPIEFFPA
jgi:periplasmic protein TonB